MEIINLNDEHISTLNWEMKIKSSINRDTGASEVRVALRQPAGNYKYWVRRDCNLSEADLVEEMTTFLNWLKSRATLF